MLRTRAWTTTVHPPRTAAEPRVTLDVMQKKIIIVSIVTLSVLISQGCNKADVSQLQADVKQIVKTTDGNVGIGEIPNVKIKQTLSEKLTGLRVDSPDTNITVNVNCGDPIYHIKLKIVEGTVADIEIGSTPICF